MNRHQTQTSIISQWNSQTPEAQQQPLLIGEKEASRLLGICERKLFDLRKAGTIPHLRVDRRVLYSVASLQDWIAEQMTGGDDES